MEQNGILFTGKKLDFKVTFLSDIVLQSSSNTEGKIDNLDFISGSSFLGIVAKNYDSFENPFEVFHSGKVRFGEATPFSNNQSTYKVPFCFFTPKSESYPLEVHKLYPDIQVNGVTCPMWVPLVENNEAQNEGADYFIRKYINQLLQKDSQIDTVILGCTHYPLLLPKIQQYIPDNIRVIAQGEYVAESLKDYLCRHPEMDIKCTKNNSCLFYTTEAEDKFIESASTFLNQQINVKRITLE